MSNATEISTITLERGDYRATLSSAGAALASLQSRGRNLVYPHTAGQLSRGYPGQVLAPWPNRITNGIYKFAGETYLAAINDHENNSALHGLVFNLNWQVDQVSESSVTFSVVLPPQMGYPFALKMCVSYALDEAEGLTVSITARNIGEETAPYGSSFHPYLTCNGRLANQCLLTVPSSQVMQTDENLAPVAVVPASATEFDFRRPALLGSRAIDNPFTGLPSQPWNVDLTDPDAGLTVRLTSVTAQPWVQVFSGDTISRRGVAVEPMTCPPDAFNSHEDLIQLQPGHKHTIRLSIRAIDE